MRFGCASASCACGPRLRASRIRIRSAPWQPCGCLWRRGQAWGIPAAQTVLAGLKRMGSLVSRIRNANHWSPINPGTVLSTTFFGPHAAPRRTLHPLECSGPRAFLLFSKVLEAALENALMCGHLVFNGQPRASASLSSVPSKTRAEHSGLQRRGQAQLPQDLVV